LQHCILFVIADDRFDLCRILYLMGMQHMKKDRGFCLLSLAVACVVPCAAQADQADAKGFVEDSSLNILTRNAYFGRDRKEAQDKAEWGQSFIAKYNSGFTQGTVGVGLDLLGQYALKLDTGRGRNKSRRRNKVSGFQYRVDLW
jgi:hypothetical protein